MKTTLLMATVAAGIALAATAEAREGRGQHAPLPSFEQLDLNSDGEVTAAEIQEAMQTRATERFTTADTNGDGALSAEEILAQADEERQERLANRVADRIEKADTNGDGLLQAEELTAQLDERGSRGPDRMFNRFDADENGSLSAEEFAKAQERMGERGRRGDN